MMNAVSAALLLVATNVITSRAAEWERLASLPEPNGGSITAVVGERLVILGGTNWSDGVKRWLDRVYVYDPVANQWSDAGRLAAPIAYSVSAMHGGTVWIAGGASGREVHRCVWKLERGTMPDRAFEYPEGRALAGGGVIGSSLYVLGGTDDMDHLERGTNAFSAVDLGNGRVTKLPDYPEPAFIIGASATCGGRFFAFGGAHWDSAAGSVANQASACGFDPAQAKWEKLAPLPFAVRGITACTLDDTHIFLGGGYKNEADGFSAESFIYDIDGGKYAATTPLPYKAMVSLVKLGGWLYCLGGEDRMKHRTDAMFRIKWRDLLAEAEGRADRNR